MAISLTKEDLLKRMDERGAEIKQLTLDRLEYPIVFSSLKAIADFCVEYISTSIEVAFSE